mmetsp:Transcript_39863/g.105304  ORF Transcript_39863/g.105304 Transcript_39863/m.105304 type:complete len:233 (+) Transcript_39863:958-1656(+)
MRELRMITASEIVNSRIESGSIEARKAPENIARPKEYLLALNMRKTRMRRMTRRKPRPEPPLSKDLVIQYGAQASRSTKLLGFSMKATGPHFLHGQVHRRITYSMENRMTETSSMFCRITRAPESYSTPVSTTASDSRTNAAVAINISIIIARPYIFANLLCSGLSRVSKISSRQLSCVLFGGLLRSCMLSFMVDLTPVLTSVENVFRALLASPDRMAAATLLAAASISSDP